MDKKEGYDIYVYIHIYVYTCIYFFIVCVHTHVHTHTMEYNPAMRKKKVLPFATKWITWGHYAKWNPPDRERQIQYGLTYMWNIFLKADFVEIE